METKHPIRVAAEIAYKSARTAWKKASEGNDEMVYLNAEVAYKAALEKLVSAEMAYPTARETAKRNRTLALRSRGLDI